MAVYKPYGKTASGKEEIKIPYSSIDGTPTIPTKVGELENDSGFTTNTGTITGINMNGESKGTSGVVDLGTVITDVTDKQDKLTAEQLNAVNSGITADKVSTYDGYASKISTLESKPGLDKVGTVTGVKINGETKNPASGVVDLGTFLTAQDISGKANLDGGNTFKGKQTFTDPPIDNPYSIDASGYVKGSLLQSSAVAKKDTNADKVCVFISGGFIYYRTPAEIVSDGGGATTDQIPTVNNGTLTIQKNGTKVQTFSANQSGNVTANITVPTKVSELENDSGFTKNTGTVTSVAVKMNGAEKGKVTSSGTIDLGTVITADGGTINKSKTIKMDASDNSDGANLKWGTVKSKNPYIGYASDQVDGTFVVGSLLGTNYASGLAIGGGSGNLLWKGTKVATTSDIPTFHLYEHNIYLSCSKAMSTPAPSRAHVYFTVITTSATAWNWNTLISPNYFAGKSIELNAGGYGYIADPEGNNRSYDGSVQTIFFGSSYIVVEMVYNNSLLGIDNEHSGAFFYSNDVTITDKVRTIL